MRENFIPSFIPSFKTKFLHFVLSGKSWNKEFFGISSRKTDYTIYFLQNNWPFSFSQTHTHTHSSTIHICADFI